MVNPNHSFSGEITLKISGRNNSQRNRFSVSIFFLQQSVLFLLPLIGLLHLLPTEALPCDEKGTVRFYASGDPYHPAVFYRYYYLSIVQNLGSPQIRTVAGRDLLYAWYDDFEAWEQKDQSKVYNPDGYYSQGEPECDPTARTAFTLGAGTYTVRAYDPVTGSCSCVGGYQSFTVTPGNCTSVQFGPGTGNWGGWNDCNENDGVNPNLSQCFIRLTRYDSAYASTTPVCGDDICESYELQCNEDRDGRCSDCWDPPATTGQVTTGQVTTGQVTTGQVTTGRVPDGLVTTGKITTGQGLITATTGQPANGGTTTGNPFPCGVPDRCKSSAAKKYCDDENEKLLKIVKQVCIPEQGDCGDGESLTVGCPYGCSRTGFDQFTGLATHHCISLAEYCDNKRCRDPDCMDKYCSEVPATCPSGLKCVGEKLAGETSETKPQHRYYRYRSTVQPGEDRQYWIDLTEKLKNSDNVKEVQVETTISNKEVLEQARYRLFEGGGAVEVKIEKEFKDRKRQDDTGNTNTNTTTNTNSTARITVPGPCSLSPTRPPPGGCNLIIIISSRMEEAFELDLNITSVTDGSNNNNPNPATNTNNQTPGGDDGDDDDQTILSRPGGRIGIAVLGALVVAIAIVLVLIVFVRKRRSSTTRIRVERRKR